MKIRSAIFIIVFFSLSSFGQSKSLNILVDERMELLTTIQYLSGYPFLNESENLDYKKEIDIYFKNFKDHNSIKIFRSISSEGFSLNKPVKFIFNYRLPDFSPIKLTPDLGSYDFNKNLDTLTLFINELKDFYIKSSFHEFYLTHKNFYKSIIDTVKAYTETDDIILKMEQHYGIKNKAYNIILSPLMNDAGFSIDLEEKEGKILYAIVGPIYDSVSATPHFDTKVLISDYVIHEFSHSFCNSHIDTYFTSFDSCNCLFEPIKIKMIKQGYGSWKTCLYEHLVRANEVVINEIIYGKEKSNDMKNDFINNGQWIYLNGLIKIIKEQYMSDRKYYKTIKDIIPLIINYFNKEKENCH